MQSVRLAFPPCLTDGIYTTSDECSLVYEERCPGCLVDCARCLVIPGLCTLNTFYASVGLDVTFSPISWQLKRNMCLRASECLPVRVVGPVQRDILACVSGVSIWKSVLVDSRVLGRLGCSHSGCWARNDRLGSWPDVYAASDLGIAATLWIAMQASWARDHL